MRGEKLLVLIVAQTIVGSSPHARGKVLNTDDFCEEHRIIPACAGKSTHFCDKVGHSQDHPRMRGEKAKEIS